MFVAYFAPYHYEQHVDLIAEMQTHPLVTLQTLGQTVDGHDLDLLRIGAPVSAHTQSCGGPAFTLWHVECMQ